MPTKVYRYGVLPPEGEDLVLVWEQLRLAHMYRLALWRLSSASRAQYRQRRREFFPELQETEEAIEREKELLRQTSDKAAKKAINTVMKELIAKVRLMQSDAKTNEGFLGLVSEDREREGELKRGLRGAFSRAGLYSGTYQLVEDADKRSKSGKEDPVEPQWNRSGSLGIQLQGGRTAADIMSGADPSIHVVPPVREGKGRRKGCQTIIRYRARSIDRKPRCIELKAMVDRDLPPDAKVTWAKLVVQRSGASAATGRPRFHYSVQLTIESESFHRHEFGAGEVAICFGDDAVRFAGEGEEAVTFPTPEPFKKLDDLRQIRNQNREEALGRIRGWMDEQDSVPTWLAEAVDNNAQKRSPRNTVWLVRRFLQELVVSERLAKALKDWVYHENHLYQWQEDATAKWYRQRRERYRVFAAELRRKYRHVLLDSRRLDDPKMKTQERNSRALHELRLCIKNSFGDDHVHDVTGSSCSEMFRAWRAEKAAAE